LNKFSQRITSKAIATGNDPIKEGTEQNPIIIYDVYISSLVWTSDHTHQTSNTLIKITGRSHDC